MRGLDICLWRLSLLCRFLPLQAICGAEHLIYIQLSTQTHLNNNRDPVSKQNSHCKCLLIPPKKESRKKYILHINQLVSWMNTKSTREAPLPVRNQIYCQAKMKHSSCVIHLHNYGEACQLVNLGKTLGSPDLLAISGSPCRLFTRYFKKKILEY